MKKREALGRGLESLIPGAKQEDKLIEIPTERVKPNPYQARQEFDSDELNALANSIQSKGLLQPIVVRELDDGDYELVAGERRLRACKLAGIKNVIAVRIKIIDERDLLTLNLVENIQRQNLNPIEQAEGYKTLTERFGLSHQAVGYLIGKSRVAVTNLMRLLKLAEPVREMIRQGKLSEGHGRALLAVSDPELQYKIASAVVKQGLSVEKTELLAGVTKSSKKKQRKNLSKPSYWISVEEELALSLGTKVNLKKTGKEGKIEISFYSDEELQRLFEILVSQK